MGIRGIVVGETVVIVFGHPAPVGGLPRFENSRNVEMNETIIALKPVRELERFDNAQYVVTVSRRQPCRSSKCR